ncbi:phospholipase-like protein [Tanacetum coccineum]
MDLSDIEVPRVFVTCRNMDDWTENFDNFHIQFGREEFCLVSGLKFGVENSTDYNKAKEPISFRRRVFSSDLDGGPIRGKDVELLIESDVFKKLDDNDVVSLCCVGIVQLVLLGVEDRRPVPNWILRDANVKRWQPLYASDPTNETDTKTYSIEGFAWAFKGQLPVERLILYETEARSPWWVSSRAYFDGHSFEDEQIPRHLNRNNYFEVPSEMYIEFEEQRRGYPQMKENNNDMYEKMTRFMEDMRRVPEANTTPIIVDQHFGVSDISGFQSYQGVVSAFHTLANNNSFFNMATPSNWQTPNQSNWLSPSNWQTPNPSYLGASNSQPPIPSQPGTSNWQNPMTSYSPNLPPPIPSRSQDAGILDPMKMYWEMTREQSWPESWLSSDHMNSWIQILIRERTENANWTLAKSGTVCLHQEINRFMILTDPHNIGTLDGINAPFPIMEWMLPGTYFVYMPINAGGVHWVTGAINLADSIFYVFDSMENETRMLMLEQQEDRGRQLAIMNLGHQYGEEIEAKNELLKAYEQCIDISKDKRAKIEKFLKIKSE